MFKSCFHNVTLEGKNMQKLGKGTATPQKMMRCLFRPQPSSRVLASELETMGTWAWAPPEGDRRYNI